MIIYSNGKHTVPIIGGRKIKSLDGIDWNSLHHHPIHSIAMQMTIQTIKLIKIPFYSASIYPFPSIQMIKVFYFLSSLWFFNCYMSQSLLGSSLTTPSLSLPCEGFSLLSASGFPLPSWGCQWKWVPISQCFLCWYSKSKASPFFCSILRFLVSDLEPTF